MIILAKEIVTYFTVIGLDFFLTVKINLTVKGISVRTIVTKSKEIIEITKV